MEQEKLEKIKERLKREKQQRFEAMINGFKNLKPFTKPDDIPDIPIVDKDTYETIIVPNLIRCGAIPKDKLIVGKKYVGDCRNAQEGVWNGKRFEIKRYKWGMWEDDTLNHFQDDDGHDVFVPIKIID
jgi:hypothetical protein